MSIIHFTEEEERAYLEVILHRLEWAIGHTDRETRQFAKEFRENEAYKYDQRSGMDEADVVSAEQSFKRMAFQGESGIALRRKLTRLSETPYFGRIDFIPDNKNDRLPIYIGMHSFMADAPGTYPIYDWRAPVASMFYDFELGKAWYDTPGGIVNGMIELRRQYRIRHGKMEYMLENNINIQDDLLQRELSHTSDDRMKQIVATIQRDQNAIIRNETSSVMIIQGVAGSGKTSIAIHRIAFLLYRFRDSLRSKDILIISPNKVFADYISNVLPELGEAQVPEMGMDELAQDLLDHKFHFQTFLQQVFQIVSKHDEAFIERVQFKSTTDFVSQLERYLVSLENKLFVARDIRIAGKLIPAAFIESRFKSYQRVPLLNRLSMVVKDVQSHIRTQVERKLSGRDKSNIHKAISGMMKQSNLLDVYRNFYLGLGYEHLFRMNHNVLEHADVFPLIYCKLRLEGIPPYHDVKHLVVDEMQDYSAIQYAVLSRLFPGKKTILGDASQTVNPHSASTSVEIQKVFPQADVVKLVRSYRSTYEITTFAQRIKPNPDLIAIERHGEQPEVLAFEKPEDEEEAIRNLIDRFRESENHMLAILCKSPSEASALHAMCNGEDVYLLTEDTTFFREGIIITTIPMAKGLEFDEVVVPYVSEENYHSEMDRSLLFIACTRAMHRLTLTHIGEHSKYLD